VSESRVSEIHAAGDELRRTGIAHAGRRIDPAKARAAVSGRDALHGRLGLRRCQDLRYRSLASRTKRLQRNFLVLELRSVSGAARRHSVPRAGEAAERLRSYA